MAPSNPRPRFFKSQASLHDWLERNHAKSHELWIGFYKTSSSMGGITYKQALDEALCFGWIDGVRKSLDDASYTIRFTPRQAKSRWSAVNVKRAGELTKLGLMQPAGLDVFRSRDKTRQYTSGAIVRLDPSYEQTFQMNKKAWAFFQTQAPSYQRAVYRWVMDAKQEETRLRRLGALIDDSKNERRIAPLTLPSRRK